MSPIDESTGRVRERVLRELVDHLIARGVHGLSPLGSTGEFAYLTFEQRQEIVRIVVEASAGRPDRVHSTSKRTRGEQT